jgi:hypothetical protein
MMGIKKLDELETNMEIALQLIEEGKSEEVAELIKKFKPFIKEEKKRAAGKGDTSYLYRCKGCSLGCESSYKFEPKEKYLKICVLDGSEEANYVQYDSIIDVKTPSLDF